MYEIIDAHAHVYPQKIALKAAQNVADFYGVGMSADGTVEKLLSEGKAAGISRFVVHSVATTTHQVTSINNYIIEQTRLHPEFIGYMTLHPDMTREKIRAEIDRCVLAGIKGVKLHPDFQKFAIDGIAARKIYDEASGCLPVLFHTGDKRYEYSHPTQLARIASEYPEMICIGAHFGGYSEWEKIRCYKGLENVYLDTTSTLSLIGAAEAKKFIDYFGAQWFFFGTDYPMWNPKEELARFMEIDLTETERQMILAGNLKRLLKLD